MIYMVQVYRYESGSLSQDHHNLIPNHTEFVFFNPRNVFPWFVLSFVFVRQTTVLIFSACNSELNIQTKFSINVQVCLMFIDIIDPLIFNSGILTRSFVVSYSSSIGIFIITILVFFIIGFKNVIISFIINFF